MRSKGGYARIRSFSLNELFGSWTRTLAPAGWALVLVFVLAPANPDEPRIWWCGTLFAAFAAVSSLGAKRWTTHWMRLGSLTLNLDRDSLYVGSEVRGWVALRVPLSDCGRASARLTYSRGEECEGADGPETYWRETWREDTEAIISAEGRGSRITFAIHAPAELPASRRDEHRWRLELRGNASEMEFYELYDVLLSGPPPGTSTGSKPRS